MHENAMQLKQKALKIHSLLGQNWGFKLLMSTLPTVPGAHLPGHGGKPQWCRLLTNEPDIRSQLNGEVPLCGGEALLRANATKRPMSTEQLLLLVELQVRELCWCFGPATRMLAPVVMPNTLGETGEAAGSRDAHSYCSINKKSINI